VSHTELDFVCVGHVTVDRIDGEERLGGAAAYAAITASRLGCRVALLTSARRDFPFRDALSAFEVHGLDSERTTVFENRYDAQGRRVQRVLECACPLGPDAMSAVTDRLSSKAIVLYCPVAREVRGPLARAVPDGLSAVAPQGFFRAWDAEGNVSRAEWADASRALADADLVVLSEEDIGIEESERRAMEFTGIAFGITRGERGARVYSEGQVLDVPAFRTVSVDPTGAGDVFAAAFAVALREERDVFRAATFAAADASLAVGGLGTEAIPSRKAVVARMGASRSSTTVELNE
jgi:sugar/nucleoside kinase (ribokinase family)